MYYTKLDMSDFGSYKDQSACSLVIDLLDQLERKAFNLALCEVEVMMKFLVIDLSSYIEYLPLIQSSLCF